MKSNLLRLSLAVGLVLSLVVVQGVAAQEKAPAKPQAVELGKFKMMVPGSWRQQEPKSRIITYEFAAPAAEGDDTGGRLTIMAAGGSVADNIERWYGQFVQPDGSSTKERAKVNKHTIAGQEVHVVDLSGTYKDRPAPFAPGVDREKYRMLAAIVVTDEANFFVKLYGPQRTIAAEEPAFQKMIQSLSRK